MYFEKQELLSPPVLRAAYSDRTAWIMAELSRMAYHKFEGDNQLTDIAKSLMGQKSSSKIENILTKLLSEKQKSSDIATAELESHLKEGGFTLVTPFNKNGSQALLVANDTLKMNVLVFRGTEKDIVDIKADLNLLMEEVQGYKIHSGFYKAFNEIKGEIEDSLKNLNNGYALYITGHSLGGALALLATKFLVSDSIGACYTFGSPRVASSKFGTGIKTPIYRVVNAADLVPRVPPAYLVHIIISLLEVLHIPFLSTYLVTFLEKTLNYRHHGDMRFLTACKEDCSDLEVLKNPSIIDRAIRMINRYFSVGFKVGATDHFMHNYCHKLEKYAEIRNKKE